MTEEMLTQAIGSSLEQASDLVASSSALTFGLAAGAMSIMLVAVPIIYIFFVIGIWKVFTKAGEKGWKSIIPIYNVYILASIVGLKPWLGLITALLVVVPKVGAGLAGICMIVILYFVAKSFDKDPAYTIGLVLLEPIFMAILGFGKSEFKGPAAADIKFIGKNAK